MKEEQEELALRAYYFVPYNISTMQMGVQAGHAGWRYARRFFEDLPQTWDFVDNHETTIILDGGTTNSRRDFSGVALGTLNQIGDALAENDIPFAFFEEVDLNDALTALCFIADERVWDKKKYPDFIDWYIENYRDNYPDQTASQGKIVDLKERYLDIAIMRSTPYEAFILQHDAPYKEWVRIIGGVKNAFLRELIKDKKLAR